MTERPATFGGETFDPAKDGRHLTTLLERVRRLMTDTNAGCWFTLGEIVECCGGSEASVSARLRDLRKERFGAFTISRRRRTPTAPGAPSDGLWEYSMTGGAGTWKKAEREEDRELAETLAAIDNMEDD